MLLTFQVRGQSLLKDGKGVNVMTQPELILRLVEMLLSERDKNNNSMKVEDKTNKD